MQSMCAEVGVEKNRMVNNTPEDALSGPPLVLKWEYSGINRTKGWLQMTWHHGSYQVNRIIDMGTSL